MEDAELTEATRLVSHFSCNQPKSLFTNPSVSNWSANAHSPCRTLADAFVSDLPPVLTMLEIERAKKVCPS
jgi:hypothetical protein